MGYNAAIEKAWNELSKLNPDKSLSIKFLADQYAVDLETKRVTFVSCSVVAKDLTAILLLHYLTQKLKGLPALTGEWLTFREFSGIEGYTEAFRRRAIEPIIRKYGESPEGLLSVLERLPAKRVAGADFAIVLEALEGIPALIKLWRRDAEFGPEANIFFDRSINQVFSTEDVVVLAGIIASQI